MDRPPCFCVTWDAARAGRSHRPAHRLPRFAVPVPLDNRAPLIVLPAAPGEAKLDLSAVALQVQPQRHYGQPLLLDLAGEFCYLVLVQQQLPGAASGRG